MPQVSNVSWIFSIFFSFLFFMLLLFFIFFSFPFIMKKNSIYVSNLNFFFFV